MLKCSKHSAVFVGMKLPAPDCGGDDDSDLDIGVVDHGDDDDDDDDS